MLEPGGERLDVAARVRRAAPPRARPRGPAGATTRASSSPATTRRVEGCERTWAAGDGVVSPVKFGGLATHQARRAVAAIARLAGVEDAPDPGEPVLHGRLLVGGGARAGCAGRGDAEGAPLWWPAGKVAGEYLPRWLAEHGVAPHAAPTSRPTRASRSAGRCARCAAPEAQYLYELARQFRSADPAIAALGRRMRETRER